MEVISVEIMGIKKLYFPFTRKRHWLKEEIGRSTRFITRYFSVAYLGMECKAGASVLQGPRLIGDLEKIVSVRH